LDVSSSGNHKESSAAVMEPRDVSYYHLEN